MSQENTHKISIRNVSKVFSSRKTTDVIALDDVSVDIRDNEFFTLLGPSGCGKTTLLRIIAGFEHPTFGHVKLDGEELSNLPAYKRPINTVFQNYALFPHMSVARNIAFGLQMRKLEKTDIQNTVSEMLELVQMENFADRLPAKLSGGQQQRVALARALANKPKVILLDEPLSALDFKLRQDMQSELKRIQQNTGITFIFVTHDQEEALSMSDRIAVMNDGGILQVGSPQDIYHQPEHRFVAEFIGETNFLTGQVIGVENGVANVEFSDGVRRNIPCKSKFLTEVCVAVRPEQLDISTGQLGLDVTITDVSFMGADTMYQARSKTNDAVMIRVQSSVGLAKTFQPGDKLKLDLPHHGLRIVNT